MKYTAREATADYFLRYADRIEMAVVAHTPHRTFGVSDRRMDEMTSLAKKTLRHVGNVITKELYGRKGLRDPDRNGPLILTTLEGATTTSQPDLTLHGNFLFGNLPNPVMTAAEFHALFRFAWVDKACQSDDIRCYRIAGSMSDIRRFINYFTKETEHGNAAAWDEGSTRPALR